MRAHSLDDSSSIRAVAMKMHTIDTSCNTLVVEVRLQLSFVKKSILKKGFLENR